MISYLYTKKELAVFSALACGGICKLAYRFVEIPDENEYDDIISSLEAKGYIRKDGGVIKTDLVQSYLFAMMSGYEKKRNAEHGKYTALYCRDLIVVLASDKYSPILCRVMPFRNEESLNEWIEEEHISLSEEIIYPESSEETEEQK